MMRPHTTHTNAGGAVNQSEHGGFFLSGMEVKGMAEYIELTEELILSMRAGARAISRTKKYHGTIFVTDAFTDNPKEIEYLKAAEVLYAASEKDDI